MMYFKKTCLIFYERLYSSFNDLSNYLAFITKNGNNQFTNTLK